MAMPIRLSNKTQKYSPNRIGIKCNAVQLCISEINRNIEKERNTQETYKRRLRQQVIKHFYAQDDNDTDRHN